LEAPVEAYTTTGDTLKRKGIGYSLTGVTSGIVKKRQVGKIGKTCGIFAKDWPEWLMVESAFDMDVAWVYVQEANFVPNLASLYLETIFIVWEPELVLPPVNFIFCSHWLPPLTNKIWQCNRLEVLLVTLDKLRITKAWDWKCVPIEIKHSDVGDCSDIKLNIHTFVRRYAWLVDVKVVKKGPRMVSSFCKDNLFGFLVANGASRGTLIPQVHSDSLGVHHGDGMYPAIVAKPQPFLLRPCRTSTGWCKRKLDAAEVLSLYDIIDTVVLALTQSQRSKVIGVHHLTPVKILLSAALAVIKEVRGGGR
jgi:hypothetical protein